ncbi:hypothetical protein NKG94_51325 [Micromonospora sp. M12]
MLTELAGLPGAPVRISQAVARYEQGPDNRVSISRVGPPTSGSPPVFHLLLPQQTATNELVAELRVDATHSIVNSVVGGGATRVPRSRRSRTPSSAPPPSRPVVPLPPRHSGWPRCRLPFGTPGSWST